ETYIDVSTEHGIISVKVNKETGLITQGPSSLRGMYLPVPMPSEDTSSLQGNSLSPNERPLEGASSIEGDATESEWADITFDSVVLEAAEVGKKVKTPTGKEVDAIIRVISPGPGNSRTRFYYTKNAIETTLNVFEGKKMYTDHLLEDEARK